MKVRDLLEEHEGVFRIKEITAHGQVIALDSFDGHILFDTAKNRPEYVEKYFDGEVNALWADMVITKGTFGDYCKAVLKCYVLHDSWGKQL